MSVSRTAKNDSTSPDLMTINNFMFDMQVDLLNAYETLGHIGVSLFEECTPSDKYEYFYDHYESMFWLALHALEKFVDRYDLLIGGDGNGVIEQTEKRLAELKSMKGVIR